jgi:phosphoglycerate dehydrogenase-like enzyme
MQVVNADSPERALQEIADADGMFGKITPELLAAAKQLRWVQTATASLEHYVFPELIEHPLTLTNMRGLFSDVIADHVFGYILCFARNLHTYIRQQSEARYVPVGGEEERSNFAAGTCWISSMDRAHLHVSDCTLGIVGLGQIGSEIARRAKCFGMRVLAVDPYQTAVPEGVEAIWQLDRLPQLLGESDFVVVAAPHTPETAGMFQREQFQQMKPNGYFINIGRGAIVSLAALTAALVAGEIAGAALDVFEIEPLPPEHPLWAMPNVIITPHVAACSVRLAERHLHVLLQNVHNFAQGKPLQNLVRKDKWF